MPSFQGREHDAGEDPNVLALHAIDGLDDWMSSNRSKGSRQMSASNALAIANHCIAVVGTKIPTFVVDCFLLLPL